MRTFQQVRDILNVIREYHQRFRTALEDVECTADSDLTVALAQQLQLHEQRWRNALKKYGDAGEEAVLNSYIQYVPDDGVREMLVSIQVTPEMSMGDFRQLVIRFHSALTELYGTLRDEVDAPHVKELFTSLHDMEQSLTAEQAWAGRST
jgi:hypothetical protein